MSVKVCLWNEDQDNSWDDHTLPQRTGILSRSSCLCDCLGNANTAFWKNVITTFQGIKYSQT